MNWESIQAHWPELKKAIRDEYPDLDTDALEKTSEGRTQLLQLIDAEYGAGRPVAADDVDALVAKRKRDEKADQD